MRSSIPPTWALRSRLIRLATSSATIDEIDSAHIRARLIGEKLDYDRHEFETEIKAVTYHQLSVTCENGRWRARVIFDV